MFTVRTCSERVHRGPILRLIIPSTTPGGIHATAGPAVRVLPRRLRCRLPGRRARPAVRAGGTARLAAESDPVRDPGTGAGRLRGDRFGVREPPGQPAVG